jgi:hypothetical protein
VKQRLREHYRRLDPVVPLAEVRATDDGRPARLTNLSGDNPQS